MNEVVIIEEGGSVENYSERNLWRGMLTTVPAVGDTVAIAESDTTDDALWDVTRRLSYPSQNSWVIEVERRETFPL